MDNLRIALLHPFTPGAGGLKEKSIPEYHSQPHALALNKLDVFCTMPASKTVYYDASASTTPLTGPLVIT